MGVVASDEWDAWRVQDGHVGRMAGDACDVARSDPLRAWPHTPEGMYAIKAVGSQDWSPSKMESILGQACS